MNRSFWDGKRVLLTGHTGFKGGWMALWLRRLGASVTGYSLAPDTEPNLFDALAPWNDVDSIIGDVRDAAALRHAVERCEPEIVIHMAAQPLVRASYADPVDTLTTNVIGTANLLQALRAIPAARVALIVTSDKVYDQAHGTGAFVESDPLGGSDPYSASKAAQELVTTAFARSFLEVHGARVATSRAGNVIGGGDWAADRLIPDFFRAAASGEEFAIRYPSATRPWQHVLEPLSGYLVYVEKLWEDEAISRSLNFGPNEPPATVAEVIAKFEAATGWGLALREPEGELWPEHSTLELDSGLAAKELGWQPRLSLDRAIRWTADWYKAHSAGADIEEFSIDQIAVYESMVQ